MVPTISVLNLQKTNISPDIQLLIVLFEMYLFLPSIQRCFHIVYPLVPDLTINLDEVASDFSSFTVATPDSEKIVSIASSSDDLTMTLTANGEGEVTFTVLFSDMAGNSTQATFVIEAYFLDIVSTTPGQLTGVASDGVITTSESARTSALLTAPVVETKQVTAEYVVQQTTIAPTCDASVGTYTSSLPLISDLATDGDYYICIRLVKEYYNTLYYPTPLHVLRDTVVFDADASVLRRTFLVDTSYTFDLDSIFSGVSTYAIARGPNTAIATVVLQGSQITIRGVLSGRTTFILSGIDTVGNVETEIFPVVVSSGIGFIPIVTPSQLTGVASDGVINAVEAALPAFPLITAPIIVDVAGHLIEYGIIGVAHGNLASDNWRCTARSVNARGYTTTLPTSSHVTGDGARHICVRVRKENYIDTYLSPIPLVLDTTPPSIADITDFSGGELSYEIRATIDDNTPRSMSYQTVSLSDTGDCDSSTTGFSDPIIVTAFHGSVRTNPVTLQYDGRKKICFKVTDHAGNSAYAASGIIYKPLIPLSVQVYQVDAEGNPNTTPVSENEWTRTDLVVVMTGLSPDSVPSIDLSGCRGCEIKEGSQTALDDGEVRFTLITGDSTSNSATGGRPRQKILKVSYATDFLSSKETSFSFRVDKIPPVVSAFPDIPGLNGTWASSTIPHTLLPEVVTDPHSGFYAFEVWGFVDTADECNVSVDTSGFFHMQGRSLSKEIVQHHWTHAIHPRIPRMNSTLHGKHLCAYFRDRPGNVTVKSTPILFDLDDPKVIKQIPNQALDLTPSDRSVDIILSEYFSDATSPLSYIVQSSSPDIVTARVAGETLTLRAVVGGGAIITVHALDGAKKKSDIIRFRVSVGDSVKPTLLSAEIPPSGDRVLLTFDESIDTDSVPDISSFFLTPLAFNSSLFLSWHNPVSYLGGPVSVDGAVVSLPLRVHWSRPDTLTATISYTAPDEQPLHDEYFNVVSSFVRETVTVNAVTPPDTTPPVVRVYAESGEQPSSPTLSDFQRSGTTPDRLFFSSDPTDTLGGVAFNASQLMYVVVDDVSTDTAKETGVNRIYVEEVDVASVCPSTFSEFSQDAKMRYTLFGAADETVYSSLISTAGKKLCIFVDDLKGNTHAQVLETETVPIGLPDVTVPQLLSATFSPDNDAIILTLDEGLDKILPLSLPTSAFSLDTAAMDSEGDPVSFIRDVSLSDSRDVITLSLSVLWGSSRTAPTVTYTPPSTNALQDGAGNKMATFSVLVPLPVQDPEEEDTSADEMAPSLQVYMENEVSPGLQTTGVDADQRIFSYFSGRSKTGSVSFPSAFSNSLYLVSEDSTTSNLGVGIEYFLFKVVEQSVSCPTQPLAFSDAPYRFFGLPRVSHTIASDQIIAPSFQGRKLCILTQDVDGNALAVSFSETPSSVLTLSEVARDGYISLSEISRSALLVTPPPVPSGSDAVTYALAHSAIPLTACDADVFSSSREDITTFSRIPTTSDLTKDGDYYLCVKYSKTNHADLYSVPFTFVRDATAPVADETLTYTVTLGTPFALDLSDFFTGADTYTAASPVDTTVVTSAFSTPILTLTGIVEGTTTIVVTGTDEVGNSTEAVLTVTISLPDITVLTSAALTSSASDGFINITESFATSPLLTAPVVSTAGVTVTYTVKQSDTTITACNASVGTYTTVIPIVDDLTKDGDHYLCTKYSKINHADLYSAPLKLTRDTIAPVADDTLAYTVTLGTSLVLDLSDFFTGADTYTTADPVDTDVVTSAFSTPTLTLTGVTVGTTTIAVISTDEAGNSIGATLTITVNLADITVTTHSALTSSATDGFINDAESTETSALLTIPVVSTAGVTVTYTLKQSDTAITTCDATTGTYSTTVPTASSLTKDGDHYLCTKYSKINHADLYSTPLTVVRDTIAPVANETLAYTVILGTPLALDLSDFFTGADTYTTANPVDTTVVTSTFSTPTLTLTGVAEGTTTIAVTGTDEAGNSTSATLTLTINPADITVTTHSALTSSATDGFINTIESTGTSALLTTPVVSTAGVTVTYTLKQSDTTITACDASVGTYSTAVPAVDDLTTDGNYYLCVKYSKTNYADLYSVPLTFVRDTIAPVANETLAYTVILGTPLALDLSDFFTGADTYTADDPADTTVVTSAFSTPTLTLTGVAEGTTTIAVIGTDEAGNSTEATLTLTINPADITVTTHSALTSSATDGFINNTESSGTSALLTTPVVSTTGVTVTYTLKQSDTAITACNASVGTYTAVVPVADDLTKDGDYYLCAKYSKTNYEDLYSAPLKLTRDTIAPVADDTLAYTITSGTSLALDLSTFFTGADTYTTADPVDTTVVTSAFSTPTLTLTGAAEGTTTIVVTGTDEAGNSTEATLTLTINPADITVTTHSALTSSATDGFINNAESSGTSPLLTTPVVSTTGVTVTYTLKQSDTTITTCDATTGTYSTTVPTASSLTKDGDHYLCTKYSKTNHADLYSAPLTFVRDTVAPVADDTLAYTITSGTSLALDLSDFFTGADTYTVANPVDTDVVTSAFSTPTLTLTGVVVGTTTIAVTGTDEAGNNTSATLTLTINPADITVTTHSALTSSATDGFINNTESSGTSALLTAPVVSTAGVTVTYAMKQSDTAITTCDATTGTYSTTVPTASSLTKDGDHYLCTKYSKTNHADLYSAPLKLTRDTVAPVANETLTYTVTLGTPLALDLSDFFTGADTYTTADPVATTVVTSAFSTPTLTLTGVVVGTTTIAVTGTDEAGNSTEATLALTISLADIVVTTHATLGEDVADGFINNAESTETSTLLTTPVVSTAGVTVTYTLKQSDTTITTCDATTGTYSTAVPAVDDLTKDGDHYLCVKYSKTNYADLYSAPLTFVRDIVAPVVDDIPLTYTIAFGTPLALDLSDFFTGADTYTADDPADTDVVTATFSTPTLTLTGVDGGTTTVVVTGVDDAGNSAEATLTITISLPGITVLTPAVLAAEATDGFINNAESSETSALFTTPVVSTAGVTVSYTMKQSDTTITTCDATTGTYSTTVPTASSLTKDGDHYLCVKYSKTNHADLYSAPLKLTRDTTAPESSETLAYTVTLDTPLALDLSDFFTGADTYTAANPVDTAVVTSAFSTPTLTLTGVVVGTTTIAVTGTDEAGNSTEATLALTISLADIVVTTHATLGEDVADGFINNAESTETSALLTAPVVSTAGVTVTYTLKQSDTAITTCDATTGTYSTAVPAVDDLTTDGDYYLCTKYSKTNHADLYSVPLTFVRDIVAPAETLTFITGDGVVGGTLTLNLARYFGSDAVTFGAEMQNVPPTDPELGVAVITRPPRVASRGPAWLRVEFYNAGTIDLTLWVKDAAGNRATQTFRILTPKFNLIALSPELNDLFAEDGHVSSAEFTKHVDEDLVTFVQSLKGDILGDSKAVFRYLAEQVEQSDISEYSCSRQGADEYSSTKPTLASLSDGDGMYAVCVEISRPDDPQNYVTGHSIAPSWLILDTTAPKTKKAFADAAVEKGDSLVISVPEYFVAEDDGLTYTATSADKEKVTVSIDDVGEMTLSAEDIGSAVITVSATDVAGNATQQTFTVTVSDVSTTEDDA